MKQQCKNESAVYVSEILKDDLNLEIKERSKVSIAADCISMYAYKELKSQLENEDESRFIITSPTFVTEKEKRFYIPRLSRERSIYGTEFELKLRNEQTQKAIAKECVDWTKQKVVFNSNVTNESIGGFLNIETEDNVTTYMPITGFTTADIGCERGNNGLCK